jgi:hypothetical protein
METTFETTQKDIDKETNYQIGKESMKAEIISLIYSMILNKEVDDVEGAKIVNKIRQ